MGDLAGDGDSNENPIHDVRIEYKFSVGKYEVTFEEWDACVSDGGCGGHRPSDAGWGRGDRPVINVTWYDAKQYVSWLSSKTGLPYRLLSESEWEYVARSGNGTKYSYGNGESALCTYGNGADRSSNFGWKNASCDDGYGQRTAPVGRFSANGFGLYDVHGNVWEWVEDCGFNNYTGAPADGSAWTAGGKCSQRILRGGSWDDAPRILRAAVRLELDNVAQVNYLGLRVARTLSR